MKTWSLILCDLCGLCGKGFANLSNSVISGKVFASARTTLKGQEDVQGLSAEC